MQTSSEDDCKDDDDDDYRDCDDQDGWRAHFYAASILAPAFLGKRIYTRQ